MDPGNADREELENRVEQLEQTVSKMLPDRRGVLKGLGAAAVGGAAVGASSGGASGQSGAAGRQGTPENPNDMYAWDLDVANQVVTDLPMGGNDIKDAGSVSADKVTPNAPVEQINVPSDVSTLGDAVRTALYTFPDGDQTNVVVNIESGHEIKTGSKVYDDPAGQSPDLEVVCYLEGVDASHIWIESDDSTVPVESGFEGHIFRTIRGAGPVLNCQIDGSPANDLRIGYGAELGSVGFVEPNSGVTHCGEGLLVRQNSLMYAAFGVDFSNASVKGCNVNHGSIAYVRDGDFSGSAGRGIRARGAALIDADGADVSDCDNGIKAIGSGVYCPSLLANSCASYGILATEGSEIYGDSVDVSNAGAQGINAEECTVYCPNINASSCGIPVWIKNGTVASLDGGDLTGADNIGCLVEQSRLAAKNLSAENATNSPLEVTDGGTASVRTATLGSSGSPVLAETGARLVAPGADCVGSGVKAKAGSTLVIRNGNARQSSGTNSSSDIVVNDGSIVDAHDATGGVSQSTNTLTSDGVIFQA